jgi:hypothetical protein
MHFRIYSYPSLPVDPVMGDKSFAVASRGAKVAITYA